MTTKSVKLRETRDGLGTRYLDARLLDDGSLSIQGQDIGAGVERAFGYGEYEWAWTVRPEHVADLLSALDSGDDVLAALARRFSGDAAAGVKPFLDEHGIPYESWSRIGD
jgi:hypothetical protein